MYFCVIQSQNYNNHKTRTDTAVTQKYMQLKTLLQVTKLETDAYVAKKTYNERYSTNMNFFSSIQKEEKTAPIMKYCTWVSDQTCKLSTRMNMYKKYMHNQCHKAL